MIVLDGALGTELARRGVDTRGPLFSAAALLGEAGRACVRGVHRDSVAAGAQVVTAGTFRTGPRAAGARWRELTAAAVRLAQESGALVAGSIAPVEDCYRPELRPPAEVALREDRALAEALREDGCDLLLVETVAAADEGLAAVEAAAATGLPVWVSAMALPSGTMRSGDDLRVFFRAARERGAAAALINCTPCDGVDLALDAARESGLVFGAYAHMGEVDPASGWPSTPVLTPDEYAARAARWLARGARILGGCCGTTPDHVAALARLSPERHDPLRPERLVGHAGEEGHVQHRRGKGTSLLEERERTSQGFRDGHRSPLAAVARHDFDGDQPLALGSAPDDDVQLEGVAPHAARLRALPDGFELVRGGKTERLGPGARVQLGRYILRLSHQNFPAVLVLDPHSPRLGTGPFPVWFDPDPAFRVEARLVQDQPPREEIVLSTRGNKRRALRLGQLRFTLQGEELALSALRLLEPGQDEAAVSVFFRDATSGSETYGIGRYLEPEPLGGDRYVLDFNRAYNPTCVFSPLYNCPIPPRENVLPVAVRAGERDPGGH